MGYKRHVGLRLLASSSLAAASTVKKVLILLERILPPGMGMAQTAQQLAIASNALLIPRREMELKKGQTRAVVQSLSNY